MKHSTCFSKHRFNVKNNVIASKASFDIYSPGMKTLVLIICIAYAGLSCGIKGPPLPPMKNELANKKEAKIDKKDEEKQEVTK